MRGIVSRFPKFAYAHIPCALRGPYDLQWSVRIAGLRPLRYASGMLPNNNSRPRRGVPRNLTEKEKAELEVFCKEYADWIWRTFRQINMSEATWNEFLALTEFPDRNTLEKAPSHERSKHRRESDA